MAAGDSPVTTSESGWRLTSSNGYTELAVVERTSGSRGRIYDVTCQYAIPLRQAAQSRVLMEAVALSGPGLRDLAGALDAQLNRPLNQLNVEAWSASFDLAAGDGDALRLVFGAREDLIATGRGRIPCLVEMRRDALAAQIALIADVTTLSTLHAGLVELISS